MRARYKAIEQLEYKIEEPIDILFNTIEDLGEIAELARRPYFPAQIVYLGYIVVSKNRVFRSDIWKWMRRPEYYKTWTIFKDTFTEARRELIDTDATVDELGFRSANAIVTQIVEQLWDEIPATEYSPPPHPPNPPAPDNLPTVVPGAANSIQQADLEIAALMQP